VFRVSFSHLLCFEHASRHCVDGPANRGSIGNVIVGLGGVVRLIDNSIYRGIEFP